MIFDVGFMKMHEVFKYSLQLAQLLFHNVTGKVFVPTRNYVLTTVSTVEILKTN